MTSSIVQKVLPIACALNLMSGQAHAVIDSSIHSVDLVDVLIAADGLEAVSTSTGYAAETLGVPAASTVFGLGTFTLAFAARYLEWDRQQTIANYQIAAAELKNSIAENDPKPISSGNSITKKVAALERQMHHSQQLPAPEWTEVQTALAIIERAQHLEHYSTLRTR